MTRTSRATRVGSRQIICEIETVGIPVDGEMQCVMRAQMPNYKIFVCACRMYIIYGPIIAYHMLDGDHFQQIIT